MKTLAEADLSSLELGDLLSLADEDSAADGVQLEPAAARGAHEIAIIGLSGKIASCADLDAFWELLRDGKMTRRSLPHARQADVDEFLRLKGAQHSSRAVHYFKESYLTDIDRFDHRFFGMAKQEANLTDPNQRMFLEAACGALEHAGYGGAALKGRRCGVFVGFSADFGDAYRDIVRTLAPDAPEVAVVGNVKSIIAARIAYHLDLHGPSMMIDTACSSGLVAVHQACRALQNGDCDVALAGAVKIDLVPVADDPQTKVGVKDIQATMASDGRTKTFDDDSEGTSGAEGVVAFVLKPLAAAQRDGDTIHAVILGSAINQDGQSVGITAPNMAAQEDLIVKALEDAQIHPETVSYIEAHGTATKLGDPVEVAGITRAFRHFTKRNQFCAIGSVKTNIGHMDNAAGVAGLAKLVLALRHRSLPASLNFNRPNRNINFPQSPLYVNDRFCTWLGEPGQPLRAGINSFGLSGTNCHVIVQEAPAAPARSSANGPFLLPLAAASEHALERLLQAWHKHLQYWDGALQDLCFTAATGRGHHNHRAALLFSSLDELRTQLAHSLAHARADGAEGAESAHAPGVAFGFYRVVDDKRAQSREDGQISESDKKQLDRQAQELGLAFARADAPNRARLMQEAQQLYVRGADLEWEQWFTGMDCRRIPLPTYPFAATRCWVEVSDLGTRAAGHAPAKQFRHPLLDRLAASSYQFQLYETMLGAASHWELGEHKVKGHYVLPGTAYIEMLLEVGARLHGGPGVPAMQLEQLVFLRPFMLEGEERRALQLSLLEQDGAHKVRVLSCVDGEWQVHAEAILRLTPEATPDTRLRDAASLLTHLPERMIYTSKDDASRGLEIGARWNKSVQEGWFNTQGTEVLVRLSLPDIYQYENALYHFHPALLDTAVNAANHLVGDGGLYLPFAYRRLQILQRLPSEFWVHLKKKEEAVESIEAFHFDIELFDLHGHLCARVNDYTVKLVAEGELGGTARESHMHALQLAECALGPDSAALPPGAILLAHGLHSAPQTMHALLQQAYPERRIIDLPASGSDYARALAAIDTPLAAVLYLSPAASESAHEAALLQADPAQLLNEFYHFNSACMQARLRVAGNYLLYCQHAFNVADHGAPVRPEQSALAALARIVRLENPQMKWRCFDSDGTLDAAQLAAQLQAQDGLDHAVYRQQVRYRERLQSIARIERARFSPRHEGVYVITGGLGALGLELAGWLTRKGAVNLALISSTGLPQRDEWDDIVNDDSEISPAAEKVRRSIASVLALEKAGSRVEFIAADSGDMARMQEVLQDLRREYGRINGVVHAAGRAGDGFLHNKPHDVFARVLRPKVDGAWVLHQLTLGDPLDFFIMYSSVATVLRSPGQSDYTAANAYLDGLAHYRRSIGLCGITLCWPAWREVGIAVEYGAVDENEFFAPIDNKEALELMEQVLCDEGELPPVLILSEINARANLAAIENLHIEVDDGIRARFARPAARKSASSEGGSASEVAIDGMEADEVTQQLARLWGRILGLHELGADEHFADYGGNSILTTQLYTELDRLWPGTVDVVDLFSYTTLRTQSAFIHKALGLSETPAAGTPAAAPITLPAANEDEEMDRILALLAQGDISAEEAQKLL
ncbi:SDR family NAD(P)-dependent oxidoreductase [Massilia sp. W12]|uniref:SDR family NAD(P)-dependent oxidoreductase n=1 Tax=Massilia sp. W12 TaxID=3126507 RepID=UPI0030D2590F